jgi:hypothetical protein
MNDKKIIFVGHTRRIEPIGIVTEYTLLLENGTKETYSITDPIPSVSFSQVKEIEFKISKENSQ